MTHNNSNLTLCIPRVDIKTEKQDIFNVFIVVAPLIRLQMVKLGLNVCDILVKSKIFKFFV